MLLLQYPVVQPAGPGCRELWAKIVEGCRVLPLDARVMLTALGTTLCGTLGVEVLLQMFGTDMSVHVLLPCSLAPAALL